MRFAGLARQLSNGSNLLENDQVAQNRNEPQLSVGVWQFVNLFNWSKDLCPAIKCVDCSACHFVVEPSVCRWIWWPPSHFARWLICNRVNDRLRLHHSVICECAPPMCDLTSGWGFKNDRFLIHAFWRKMRCVCSRCRWIALRLLAKRKVSVSQKSPFDYKMAKLVISSSETSKRNAYVIRINYEMKWNSNEFRPFDEQCQLCVTIKHWSLIRDQTERKTKKWQIWKKNVRKKINVVHRHRYGNACAIWVIGNFWSKIGHPKAQLVGGVSLHHLSDLEVVNWQIYSTMLSSAMIFHCENSFRPLVHFRQ